jgi:hypothetical protein
LSHTDTTDTERPTVHASFVIERTYATSPAAVFAAWADEDSTRLTLTEHGVFLDGLDTPAEREHGTNALMDALGTHLTRGGK